ncbi:TIGR01777 family oxidoreductase [Kaistella polysaccharea]|uniref:TIGR01777 family oxidoreductase n=1 Tax=Kaistella polysaccharea TaxID=2878534 RepID=UPI001CF5FC92|nr:TIGR01777 family oxidoreductase [Kaistella polysaccharea]
MNILITGGTGLVGEALTEKLRNNGHQVRILSRKQSENKDEFYWNLSEGFIDDAAFTDLECIIHLAGATISQRWTPAYKEEMFSSRVDTAKLLKKYCLKNEIKLKSFISASGINYYGTFISSQILEENSGIVKNDYLAQLCKDWENAAEDFSDISERVVCLRTAMILAKTGGAFPLLAKTVDLNIGSAVGTGEQWMNWIHLEDMVNMYIFAVENKNLNGKYNAVADDIPTNKNFMQTLAKMKDKYFLPINAPAFVMKALLGEMSSIILEGTRADNKKIKSAGFDFTYSNFKEALKNLT